MIHPAAFIDPSAKIGADVNIGPGCVISAGVEIGDGCQIHPHAVIYAGVKMGTGNTIHAGAVLGDLPQDLGFSATTNSFVTLGNNNTIREHATLHRGSKEGSATVVGDDCYLMAGSHLGHDVHLGNRVILANNCLLAGHVKVNDRVFFGGGSVAHQFTRVGHLAIVQGLAGFSKDVPPFCMAAEINMVAGLNTVGLKRAGYGLETRREIKAAFDLVYREGLNVAQALAVAEQKTWGLEASEFFDFIRQGTRGICALLSSE